MERPSWDEFFIAIAAVYSSRGSCDRLRVACVLVKDKKIVNAGYNGSMADTPTCDEVGHDILNDHCVRSLHAELNALSNAKCDLNGATAYIIHTPCLGCVKQLGQNGISRIVYVGEYDNKDGGRIDKYCYEKGISLERFAKDSEIVASTIFKKIFDRLQGPGGIFRDVVLPSALFGPRHANVRLMGGGKLILFEGIDGCGKSTQIKMLKKDLEKKGLEIFVTKEPGGGLPDLRERIINLKEDGEGNLAERELELFEEDRSVHYREKVLPALAAGKIVLQDRGGESTIAYQGYGRGMDLELIAKANDRATYGRKADLTILLDINVSDALERMRIDPERRLNRFEKDPVFLEKVKMGYLKEALKHTADRTWQTVWAADKPYVVFEKIKKVVEEKLGL